MWTKARVPSAGGLLYTKVAPWFDRSVCDESEQRYLIEKTPDLKGDFWALFDLQILGA